MALLLIFDTYIFNNWNHMRTIFVALLVLIGLTSCTRTVEVPVDHVGVVYDSRTGEVVNYVFESGSHSISKSSSIVTFDTTVQKMDFSFDILFAEGTPGKVQFSIEYKLNVDNLPKICEKYGQPALVSPLEDHVILTEIRSQIRNSFEILRNSGLNNKIIFDLIETSLTTTQPATELIEIVTFTPGEVSGLL